MPPSRSDLEAFMQAALREAELGLRSGELGVGAVLVISGQIVAAGRSRQVERGSALAHAELDVLWRGSERLASYGEDAILVTTVEPCLMCLGAALRLGISHIVYGMTNPNAGQRLIKAPIPGLTYEGGILASTARELMEPQ